MRWKISITQNKTGQILKNIQIGFNSLGISVGLYNKNHDKKAECLEFGSVKSILKLINLINHVYSNRNPFRGVKARNYYLLVYFLTHFDQLTDAQKIGLAFTFNKSHQNEHDKKTGLTRKEVCFLYGVNMQATYNEPKELLTLIDVKYKRFREKIQNDIKHNQSAIVSPYYLVGLMEGDGSYLLHSFEFRYASDYPICFFESSVRLITHNDSLILHDIYKHTLKLKTSGSFSKQKNATSIAWTNRNDRKKVIEFGKNYPCIHALKKRQFKLIKLIEDARDICDKIERQDPNYPFRNWVVIENILFLWYQIGEINRTNHRRTFSTLNQALEKSRNHLNLPSKQRLWQPW